jgi:aryl-phospho-beta-D-glucosidase BglC (GH1 family)
MFNELSNIGKNYDVPVLIGEFTLFENKEAWQKQLNLFDQRNYSWTIWNYKTCVAGHWQSSWGVYTISFDFKGNSNKDDRKCNITNCTYEKFLKTCKEVETDSSESYAKTGTLYDVLKEYNRK